MRHYKKKINILYFDSSLYILFPKEELDLKKTKKEKIRICKLC